MSEVSTLVAVLCKPADALEFVGVLEIWEMSLASAVLLLERLTRKSSSFLLADDKVGAALLLGEFAMEGDFKGEIGFIELERVFFRVFAAAEEEEAPVKGNVASSESSLRNQSKSTPSAEEFSVDNSDSRRFLNFSCWRSLLSLADMIGCDQNE